MTILLRSHVYCACKPQRQSRLARSACGEIKAVRTTPRPRRVNFDEPIRTAGGASAHRIHAIFNDAMERGCGIDRSYPDNSRLEHFGPARVLVQGCDRSSGDASPAATDCTSSASEKPAFRAAGSGIAF